MENLIVVSDFDRLLSLGDIRDLSKNMEIAEVNKVYPFRASNYYYDVVCRGCNGIKRQLIPDPNELDDSEYRADGLGESAQMPVNDLIHRYPDRVVLLVTNQCPVHCRFCFRKRHWSCAAHPSSITADGIQAVVDYLNKQEQVREVLISGGDPLMLKNSRLVDILSAVYTVPHVETVRIGTRIPVTLPMRVNQDLVDCLRLFPSLWIATHFNHPDELTEEACHACKLFINAGIPVVNQTVLLRGVNNRADVLTQLFNRLVRNKVKPTYLFHIDPVQGVSHFATGVAEGLKLMREMRSQLSSLATPTFAIDLPDGCGKVSLQPCYEQNGQFEGIDGNYVDYPYNDVHDL